MEEYPQLLVNVKVAERDGWDQKPEIIAYIKDVESNKVFSTIDSGTNGLDSTGALSFTDLNICAKSATADSVSCSITTLY